MKLKIRYCPCCAELVHFEAEVPVQRCWNCGSISNFDMVVAPEVRLVRQVGRQALTAFDALTSLVVAVGRIVPTSSRMERVGRLTLVAAIPAIVTMLLVANSLSPTIVRDATAPFKLPESPF